jgi:DNA helicase-2/ATP-dependent DNA helicase PcrA
VFCDEFSVNRSISKKNIEKVINKMEELKKSTLFNNENMFIYKSLLRLLQLLLNKERESSLSKEEKFNKVIFVLGNGSLKHIMNEISDKVILTTIHGSKGLEWDYVYIPEITAYSFPFSRAICTKCGNTHSGEIHENYCKFKFCASLKEAFSEELSIFYVGVTRAKKDAFLFANRGVNPFGFNKRASCFIALPNLKHNKEF